MFRASAIWLSAVLVVSGCAKSAPEAAPALRPATASSAVPSPDISIYPVPSPRSPRPPALPSPPSYLPPSPPASPTPSPTPSASPPDVAGIECNKQAQDVQNLTTIVTKTTCYQVSGATMSQLDAQTAKLGPMAGGKRAVAATRWGITWKFAVTTRPDGTCSLSQPDVRLSVTFIYPTWKPPAGTSAATIQAWRSFMDRVVTHEEQHRDIAIRGAIAAHKALLATPDAASCKSVTDDADARVKAVIAEYRAKQAAFDAAAAAG